MLPTLSSYLNPRPCIKGCTPVISEEATLQGLRVQLPSYMYLTLGWVPLFPEKVKKAVRIMAMNIPSFHFSPPSWERGKGRPGDRHQTCWPVQDLPHQKTGRYTNITCPCTDSQLTPEARALRDGKGMSPLLHLCRGQCPADTWVSGLGLSS